MFLPLRTMTSHLQFQYWPAEETQEAVLRCCGKFINCAAKLDDRDFAIKCDRTDQVHRYVPTQSPGYCPERVNVSPIINGILAPFSAN